MYNYWRSASTEQVALAPKSAYIAADDAIAGYEAEWSNANVKNQAYLRYKSGTERPTRDPMPEPSQAMIAEITGADQDLYSTTAFTLPTSGRKARRHQAGQFSRVRKKAMYRPSIFRTT